MPPAGFSFVLHKAAEFRKDGAFTARWPALAAAGLLRGAWYFPRPDSTTNFTKLDAQLDIFIDLVGRLVPGDFGPMLDLEDQLDPHKPNIGLFDDSNEVRNAGYWVDAIRHLLERLETAMGRQPAIYTSRRWWHSFTNDAPGFEHYPLWVSDINHASPVLPVPWTKWSWWQWHSESSSSPMPAPFRQVADLGVDLDRFNGSVYELRGLAELGRPSVVFPSSLPGISQSGAYIAQAEVDGSLHLLSLPSRLDSDLSTAGLPDGGGDPVLLAADDALFMYYRNQDHLVEATCSATDTQHWQSVQIEDVPPIHHPRAVLNGNVRHVVYWGADDDWYLLTHDNGWSGSGGVLRNAGIQDATGAGRSTGQPCIYVTQGTPRIAGRVGTDGHLWEVWHDGTSWRHDNLTLMARLFAPAMPAATYSPAAYETSSGVAVAFRAVGGDIWVVNRADNTPTNVSEAVVATTAAGTPVSLVINDSPHIVYRGTDGFIYDIFLDAGTWRVQSVCSEQAATDPSAAGDGSSGVVAWRTADGSMAASRVDATGWACE